GGGLNALKNGKIVTYTAKDGLLSDNVSKVVDDGESLWLSTTRGISRVSKKQLQDFAEHKIKVLQPVNYRVADGLRSAQASPEVGSGGIRDSEGRMWFATTGGIAVYGAQLHQRPGIPPQVSLIEMSTEGRSLDWTNVPKVPPGGGRIQFRYSAI